MYDVYWHLEVKSRNGNVKNTPYEVDLTHTLYIPILL